MNLEQSDFVAGNVILVEYVKVAVVVVVVVVAVVEVRITWM